MSELFSLLLALRMVGEGCWIGRLSASRIDAELDTVDSDREVAAVRVLPCPAMRAAVASETVPF